MSLENRFYYIIEFQKTKDDIQQHESLSEQQQQGLWFEVRIEY